MDNEQPPTAEPTPNVDVDQNQIQPQPSTPPLQPITPSPAIQPQAPQNPLMSPTPPETTLPIGSTLPPAGPPSTLPPVKKRSKMKIFLFILGGLVLLLGIVITIMAWKGLFEIRASDNPNASLSAKLSHMKLFNLKDVPDGWKQHDSSRTGISFVAPGDWEVSENYGWSKIYLENTTKNLKDSNDKYQKDALETIQLGAIYNIKVNYDYKNENQPFFGVSILNGSLSKQKARYQEMDKANKEEGYGEPTDSKITDTKWQNKDAFEYSYTYGSTNKTYSKSTFIDFGDKTLNIIITSKNSDYSKTDDYAKISNSLTVNKYDYDYYLELYNDQTNVKTGANIDTSGFTPPSSWEQHDYPQNNFSFYTPSSWQVGGYIDTTGADETKNIGLNIRIDNKKQLAYFGQSNLYDLRGAVDFTIGSSAMSVAMGNAGWLFEQYKLKWNGLDAIAVVSKTAQGSSETTYFIDSGDSIYTFPGPTNNTVAKDSIVNSPDYDTFIKSFKISE